MNNTLPEKIIEEIKKQGIEPRPRWQFLLKRWVLWSLAIFSTILGGIAVAIIVFTFIDHDASVRIYLNESIFEDILLTIPYLWLVTLTVLVVVTKYAVRHAKFGYRYTTVRIVGAILVGSILFGIALDTMDVGERVQDFLVERAPYYDALTNTSKDSWSHPEKGLLGGTISTLISTEEFEIIDFRKKVWRVDMARIDGDYKSIIQEGSKIKIIGTMEDVSTFRAARAFPWR